VTEEFIGNGSGIRARGAVFQPRHFPAGETDFGFGASILATLHRPAISHTSQHM